MQGESQESLLIKDELEQALTFHGIQLLWYPDPGEIVTHLYVLHVVRQL